MRNMRAASLLVVIELAVWGGSWISCLGAKNEGWWRRWIDRNTMSTSVDETPILKRLTALEPELELLPPQSPMRRQIAMGSPVFEISESEADSGAEADIDSDTTSESTSEEEEKTDLLNSPVGIEMPVWIWLATLAIMIAYLWGIAYATTPVRDLSQRRM